MLTSGTLREMFHQVLPSDEIAAWAVELGFVERDRKLDVACFVRALVLAGGTPGAGLQADALHAYLDMRVPDISRAAFYKRFGPRASTYRAATDPILKVERLLAGAAFSSSKLAR